MSSAYPISAPVQIIDIGDFTVANSGDFVASNTGAFTVSNSGNVTLSPTGGIVFNPTTNINFSNSQIDNFVVTGAGDLISTTDGTTLSTVAIGATGQVLTVVGGLPAWQTPATQGQLLSLFATADGPTAAGSNTWVDLNNVNANLAATTGGVTDAGYATGGVLTISVTGVYEVCAGVAFTAKNLGNPSTFVTGPLGRASRQLRVVDGAGAIIYATVARQAEASNANPTHVAISNCKIALNANDTVKVQYRHDSPTALGILGGNRETYFSVARIR